MSIPAKEILYIIEAYALQRSPRFIDLKILDHDSLELWSGDSRRGRTFSSRFPKVRMPK